MSNPFDPDRLRKDYERQKIKDCARRDRELAVFRTICDELDGEKREVLKVLLREMDELQWKFTELIGGLFGLPSLETDVSLASQLCDDLGSKGWSAVASLGRDAHLQPNELLCMLACWEHDEEYVPCERLMEHPRWPDIDRKRRIELMRRFEEISPAPDRNDKSE